MARKKSENDGLKCSFCNKSQRDVRKLIAGPTVYICDECVDICLDIIAEERESEDQEGRKLPKPVEIKAFLDAYVIGQEKAKKVKQAKRAARGVKTNGKADPQEGAEVMSLHDDLTEAFRQHSS